MLSHIIEYECQYTDQLYKKRKIWHDGRLKYFQINNRFILYTEKDNVLLASEFKVNSKELKAILNPEGFGIEEHRVFSQFLVIISSIIDEYDRDIQVTASHVRADPPKPSVKKRQPIVPESVPTLNHTATTRDIHSKTKVITSKDKQTEGSDAKVGFNISKLTLKVNQPFKKPKRILNTNVINDLNRPSIRSKRIPETSKQLNVANNGINNMSTEGEATPNQHNIVPRQLEIIPKESKIPEVFEKKVVMEEVFKVDTKRVGRIRKIVHEPLRI
ncbi:YGR042W [Saccharomyces arboricola H-6]|uniref:YGR042W n=1 Tax=Saccharomyces arboricola (strain H-6 / AS 2.3317 / CBS 10644) TaxID=1160507 RepID=J8PNH5_SACAR|nr:YGR042W [Saccharomyces arboricola H-6]